MICCDCLKSNIEGKWWEPNGDFLCPSCWDKRDAALHEKVIPDEKATRFKIWVSVEVQPHEGTDEEYYDMDLPFGFVGTVENPEVAMRLAGDIHDYGVRLLSEKEGGA